MAECVRTRTRRRAAAALLCAACVVSVGAVSADGGARPARGGGGFAPLAVLALLCVSVGARATRAQEAALSRLDRALAAAAALAVVWTVGAAVGEAAEEGLLSWTRFGQFFMAGGVCAFVTHAACTPIDVVKTRMQTTHQGKYQGLMDGVRKIVADEGPQALLKGLGATASGYFMHGAFKYSFYEVFKVLFSETAEVALHPPLAIAAAAGFCAECIACLLLCPMEAVRIRSVSDLSFPGGVVPGLAYISRLEGAHGLYKGLPAMLLKQVPYTVGQFAAFEFSVAFVRMFVFALLRTDGGSADPSVVAFISTMAGLLAGVMAAVISHPGDTILSKVNQEEGEGGALAQIVRVVRATGFLGLFQGLTVRIVQVSCMVGGQFMIYDSIKLLCGIVPASAVAARHDAVAAAAAPAAAPVKAAAPVAVRAPPRPKVN